MSELFGKDIGMFKGEMQFANSQNFGFKSSEENLKQAIFTRLQTIKGEYYNVSYGSELNKTLGKPRNELTRTQMIGYVGECLRQEPRIQTINDIEVNFPEEDERKVEINITVTPIGEQVPLNLIFPFFI